MSSDSVATAGSTPKQPWGLHWRASVWFTTLVVGLGVATDSIVYSLPIPFLPFELQKLGYDNISSLSGWLLFAFSGGLVFSTPFLSILSEHYQNRRVPLILGLLSLIGSQIMFMEAPAFWVFCLARILQGISSSAVWIVGLALLSETVPKEFVGRQLGLATAGLSLGVLAGPPLGGLLYKPFGIRGPVILGIGVTVVDLVGRLLIIERKDALKWGFDPAAVYKADMEASHVETAKDDATPPTTTNPLSEVPEPPQTSAQDAASHAATVTVSVGAGPIVPTYPPTPRPSDRTSMAGSQARMGIIAIVWQLLQNRRALVAFIDTLLIGVAFIAQEPTLPVHLGKTWGLSTTIIGVVMMAPILPALFTSPTAGWLADRYGSGWVIPGFICAAIPFWLLQIIPNWLALFIVSYAIAHSMTSSMFAPLTAELAAVAQSMEHVGYAHVYGVFNIAYGLGSAIGPIIGGQIYDHTEHGWTAVILLAVGAMCMASGLAFSFIGETSPAQQVIGKLRNPGVGGVHVAS